MLYARFTLFLAVSLTACGWGGGITLSPDVIRTDKNTGELKTISRAKDVEGGIVRAFPDIPIPATHEIDLERSVIFTSPSQTVGKISLIGSGDVESLFRFFESQMEGNGWNKVNAFQSATSSLYFAKPGRFVAIIIESTGKSDSRVTINVGPE
ncbi:MAG: hypothetical protein WAX89_08210 [Alphaproteobacteria bacterium]